MQTISNKPNTKRRQVSRDTLSRAGVRATRQRALILEIVRRGCGHPDADEIYRQARAEQPRLSLSTVYRALHALKRLGLTEEVHIDDSHHHYETKQPVEHHHLVCLGCGRIIEFKYPLAYQMKKAVPGARDFDIVNTEVRATGYCARCRRKRKRS